MKVLENAASEITAETGNKVSEESLNLFELPQKILLRSHRATFAKYVVKALLFSLSGLYPNNLIKNIGEDHIIFYFNVGCQVGSIFRQRNERKHFKQMFWVQHINKLNAALK